MSISTISILIQRQLIEHRRLYAIGALVLFALLMFMFLVIHQWQDSFSGAVQNGVFIIGLFIAGTVFTSTMFGELSSKQSAIWLLSIPAKHAEKVFLSVLFSVPFFIICYLLIFYLADLIYLTTIAQDTSSGLLDVTKNDFYQFFFLYLILNGCILLGGVIFNRFSLIKTILGCVLLFVCINLVNNTLLTILIPEATVISSILFDSFLFIHQGENIKVSLWGLSDTIASLFVRGILPVSLWITVWLKLKEKEV